MSEDKKTLDQFVEEKNTEETLDDFWFGKELEELKESIKTNKKEDDLESLNKLDKKIDETLEKDLEKLKEELQNLDDEKIEKELEALKEINTELDKYKEELEKEIWKKEKHENTEHREKLKEDGATKEEITKTIQETWINITQENSTWNTTWEGLLDSIPWLKEIWDSIKEFFGDLFWGLFKWKETEVTKEELTQYEKIAFYLDNKWYGNTESVTPMINKLSWLNRKKLKIEIENWTSTNDIIGSWITNTLERDSFKKLIELLRENKDNNLIEENKITDNTTALEIFTKLFQEDEKEKEYLMPKVWVMMIDFTNYEETKEKITADDVKIDEKKIEEEVEKTKIENETEEQTQERIQKEIEKQKEIAKNKAIIYRNEMIENAIESAEWIPIIINYDNEILEAAKEYWINFPEKLDFDKKEKHIIIGNHKYKIDLYTIDNEEKSAFISNIEVNNKEFIITWRMKGLFSRVGNEKKPVEKSKMKILAMDLLEDDQAQFNLHEKTSEDYNGDYAKVTKV